jgi:hypothetical protein
MRLPSSVGVAPTALDCFSAMFPGLPPGANLCRASGAGLAPSFDSVMGGTQDKSGLVYADVDCVRHIARFEKGKRVAACGTSGRRGHTGEIPACGRQASGTGSIVGAAQEKRGPSLRSGRQRKERAKARTLADAVGGMKECGWLEKRKPRLVWGYRPGSGFVLGWAACASARTRGRRLTSRM